MHKKHKTDRVGSSYTPKRVIPVMWGFGAVGFSLTGGIEDPPGLSTFCSLLPGKASIILKLGSSIDVGAMKQKKSSNDTLNFTRSLLDSGLPSVETPISQYRLFKIQNQVRLVSR